MTITVILCTYNRCERLARALESAARTIVPASVDWHVLVVDNNSTDRTRAVVEEFCTRYPGRFRYLFEPRQGKSYALNSGIGNAQGDVLAFMDDDVTVEPTWLQNLTDPLRDGQYAGTGGRILLEEAFSPPGWLSLDGPYGMGGILAMFDLGNEPAQLRRPPYGTNMAFRREVFEKLGGFRVDLGPTVGNEIRGEDTEFGRRVLAAGERLWYVPSAVVHHLVPKDRIRKQYFLDWWFDYGRGMVREWGRGPDVLGIPRAYFNILNIAATEMLRLALRWLVAPKPQQRFFYKVMVWMAAGEIAEFYRSAQRS